MNIKQLAYYFLWVFKVFILKRKIPINGGIIINDRCNLKCKHCVVANLVNQDRSLQDIASDLDQLYSLGIRSLFIVGGEPFLWRDKGYNIDSIIKLAKNKGFFKVSVCTNGILPLETKADLVWVSVDGLKETHNKIRGDTYDQIINNIEESRHEGIFINFTVNSINCNEVEEMVKWTRRNQKVKGILINFHTPYPGVEYLSISGSKKERIVDEILNLKKNHMLIQYGVNSLKNTARENMKVLCV